MHIELTMREQNLLNHLIAIPPNFEDTRSFLNTESMTNDEITRVAIEYATICFCEAGDYMLDNNLPYTTQVVPDLHSTYILDVISFLLPYGLDPNGIYENENLMELLRFVDNGFLAADTLSLLLEHGGNYDLETNGETLFESVDFDVFFDAVEQYIRPRFASTVHLWMVLIGFGARNENWTGKLFKEYDTLEPFDLQKLRNHNNYYFGVTRKDGAPSISFFDKETLWEVARIS